MVKGIVVKPARVRTWYCEGGGARGEVRAEVTAVTGMSDRHDRRLGAVECEQKRAVTCAQTGLRAWS